MTNIRAGENSRFLCRRLVYPFVSFAVDAKWSHKLRLAGLAILQTLFNAVYSDAGRDGAEKLKRSSDGLIAEYNRRIFERPEIVHYYAHYDEFTPAEDEILCRYKDSYEGKHILDVGVGGGRTTHRLATSSASYVGIDYSSAMITRCRQRFPIYRFEHGDARDLSCFENDTFDLVLFSFNGIDFVDHADRALVLREVARVLAPGGLYAFSTHNLENATAHTIWREMRKIPPARGLLRLTKGLARVGLRFVNYARHYHMQVRGDGYAILLDPGHDFTLPIYYVSKKEQQRQLEAAGFEPDCCLPEYETDDLAQDRRPYSHYYVARKR